MNSMSRLSPALALMAGAFLSGPAMVPPRLDAPVPIERRLSKGTGKGRGKPAAVSHDKIIMAYNRWQRKYKGRHPDVYVKNPAVAFQMNQMADRIEKARIARLEKRPDIWIDEAAHIPTEALRGVVLP